MREVRAPDPLRRDTASRNEQARCSGTRISFAFCLLALKFLLPQLFIFSFLFLLFVMASRQGTQGPSPLLLRAVWLFKCLALRWPLLLSGSAWRHYASKEVPLVSVAAVIPRCLAKMARGGSWASSRVDHGSFSFHICLVCNNVFRLLVCIFVGLVQDARPSQLSMLINGYGVLAARPC